MATNLAADAREGPLLLQLAGRQLQVRDGNRARIRARRRQAELDVAGAGLTEAAATVFARAMHSNPSHGGS